MDRDFEISLADAAGEVAAAFTLTLHFRRRRAHEPPMHGVVFP